MVVLMSRNQNILPLSVYLTHSLTNPSQKYNQKVQRGVNTSACERLSKKLSEETGMINHVVYLLRVTNVSGNSVRKKILNGHKKAKHNNEFRFIICQKSFESQSRLNRHQTTQNKIVKVNCPNCSKRFSRKDTLKKHMDQKHGLQFFILFDVIYVAF